MYLWDSLVVLFRRWYIVLPALVLTGSGCIFATRLIAPTYQADASLLFLVPSTVEGVNAKVNPFLNFGGANGTTDIIGRIVMSTPEAQKIYASGARAKYSVAMDPSSPAPLLAVSATSSDGGQALRTMKAVVNDVQTQLAAVQTRAGAPPTTLVYTQTITESTQATELRGSIHRALAAIAAVGLIISFGLPAVVEAVIRGRRRWDATAITEPAGPLVLSRKPDAHSGGVGDAAGR